MDIMYKVVSIGVGLFVAAIIVPMALVEIANATHTGVNSSVWTMFSVLLPVLAIIALVLYFIRSE